MLQNQESEVCSSLMKSLKVVLIGDSMVGKTALVNKWVNGLFLSDASPTIGGSNMQKFVSIDGEEVDIQIWDTAGAERYRSLTPLYIKDAMACLIVFDVTNKKTFNGLGSWIKFINSHGTIPFVIIGNKEDLVDKIEISWDELFNYSQSQGAQCFITSARDGKNVDEAFMSAAKIAYDYYKVHRISQHPTFDSSTSESERHTCC